MKRGLFAVGFALALLLASCAKKENAEAPKAEAEAKPATASSGPHVLVRLKDGSRVPGMILASSPSDIVLEGDDGIERKIPMDKVQMVEYGTAEPSKGAPAKVPAPEAKKPATQAPPPPAPVATTKTYELPVGSEVSIRTNETIDSAVAKEGQTYDAQTTRDAMDADGDIVIPRGSRVRVVIRSASKGNRFVGASDLVLDLQTVLIGGKSYVIGTAEIAQKGKSGIGANRRTAEYTGGGAALGAIIGAIAGGGKGAAIGAGAGAGAGALTQVFTKGGAIKVPAESVLTFKLDKALKVSAGQ